MKKREIDTIGSDLSEKEKMEIVKKYQDRIDHFAKSTYEFDDHGEKIIEYITGKTDEIPPVTKDKEYVYIVYDKYADNLGLISLFAPYNEWTFVDHRILNFMIQDAWFFKTKRLVSSGYIKKGYHKEFFKWLKDQNEMHNDNSFFSIAEELKLRGISEDDIISYCLTISDIDLIKDEKATSAGDYILSHYPAKKKTMLEISKKKEYYGLSELLIRYRLDEIEDLLPTLLFEEVKKCIYYTNIEILCKIDAEKYEKYLLQAIELKTCRECRAELLKICMDIYGEKYKEKIFKIAKEIINGYIEYLKSLKNKYSLNYGFTGSPYIIGFIDRLITVYGLEAKEMALHFANRAHYVFISVFEKYLKHFGQDAIHDISRMLDINIKNNETAKTYQTIFNILEPFDYSIYEDRIWEIAQCDYDKVRNEAAKALAKLGDSDSVFAKAKELLNAKKAAHRDGALRVLSYLNTKESLEIITELLKTEKSDDIRDLIVKKLYIKDEIISLDEVANRVAIAKERSKLAKPAAKWLKESELPKLKWKETKTEVDEDTVRFLFYRQTREKEIQPELEAKAIYPLIERNGDFSSQLLSLILENGGLTAKNRFSLTLVGLFGDDSIIDRLEKLTIMGKTVNGPKVFGLLKTDKAVRALQRIMKHFKSKAPSVGDVARDQFEDIAEYRGMTFYELSDSIIPDFGFIGLYRELKIDGETLKAVITGDLKLNYLDKNNKRLKSLPKKASKELKEEMKTLAKEIREISKEQLLSLEQYLVTGRKWSYADWEKLFLKKPLLFAFAPGLVWAEYVGKKLNNTFRITEDASLINAENTEIKISGEIGLVHPLELDEQSLLQWKTHLADYEITQPFAQLERVLYSVDKDDEDKTFYYRFEGTDVYCGTFKNRAEKLGWKRGSIIDAGMVSGYKKAYPEQEIEVFMKLQEMYLSDWEASTEINEIFFVKLGSVKTGSYEYDEPTDLNDERLIRLKDVPEIVFSETVRDLYKITKKGR